MGINRKSGVDPSVDLNVPVDETVLDLVWQQAQLQPRATAISSDTRTLSYGALVDSVERLRDYLAAAGVAPSAFVAIHGGRSITMVMAILASMVLGAVVIPVESSLPTRRKQLLESLIKPSIVLHCDIDDDHMYTSRAGVRGLRLFDGSEENLHSDDGTRPYLVPPPTAPAYVFFTSGTSGRATAVLGRHSAVTHFVQWEAAEFAVGAKDRIPLLARWSFDAVLRDMFLPLTAGGCLCIPSKSVDNPIRLMEWLDQQAVTMFHSVPSTFASLLSEPPTGIGLERLHHVLLSGEPLHGALVSRWQSVFPRSECEFVNLYGPTETTMVKTYYRVPRTTPPESYSAGYPLPNTQIWITAGQGRLCPQGTRGEVHIRTPFRAIGYLTSETRLRHRFYRNPFREDAEDLVFKTGDIGRVDEKGRLWISGRVDDQVKIRGWRVHPAEVTAILRSCPAISQGVVIPWKKRGAVTKLAAFFVPRDGEAPTESVRRYLAERLPGPMVPDIVIPLNRLPLSANGKVDRKALLRKKEIPQTRKDPPTTATEKTVCEMWASQLEHESIGIYDDFFSVGGHSLAAAVAVARIRKRFSVEFPLRLLFQNRTVHDVAAVVDRLLVETATG